LLLSSYDENDAKQHAFLCRLLVALKS